MAMEWYRLPGQRCRPGPRHWRWRWWRREKPSGQAGVDAPVLVLGATSPREAQGGVALGLTLTVCDPAMVKSVGAACRAQNREASVHLKLDTGMGRIGARNAAEVQDVLSALEDEPPVHLTPAPSPTLPTRTERMRRLPRSNFSGSRR